MRGLIRAASFALFAVVIGAGTASAQPAKIGWINSAQILSEAPGRAEAETRFKSEVTAYQAQLQRMSDSLQTMAATYEKDAAKLDSVTRVTRAKVIQDRETGYRTRAQQLDQQMQTRQAELVRPIMEGIQKIIEQVRAEDGYSIIFDVASQSGVILAADKKLDLTAKVLARVKAAPKPTAASALTPQPAGVSRPPAR
ncbi:MAG: OmpH family outer membrane protein [Gemmatimonadaceae bacterium]